MLTSTTIIGQKRGKALTVAHIEKNPIDVEFISQPNEELYLIALKHCPRKIEEFDKVLKLIPQDYLSDEFLLKYIQENPYILEHSDLENKSADFYLQVVQQNGYALRFLRQQTPEICLAAVQQDGEALRYVRQQTAEICLAAVKRNPSLICSRVQQQTPEICLAAVQQNGDLLRYVQQQTPEICLAAVRQDADALKYVEQQSEEICLAAMRKKTKAIELVRDPALKTKLLAEKTAKAKNKHLRLIPFDLTQSKQPRQAKLEYALSQQLDPEQVIQAIHQNWYQNRYQDEYWLKWIAVMNNEQSTVQRFKSHVLHEKAFIDNPYLLQLHSFNLYHFLRIFPIYLANQYQKKSFLEFELPQSFIDQINIAEVDIYQLIDFLKQHFGKSVDDVFILNYLLERPQHAMAKIIAKTQNIQQFAIDYFEHIQNKVEQHINEAMFRIGLKKLLQNIPQIDQYFKNLIYTYKTKSIHKDIVLWLADYPTVENQKFLIDFLNKEKDYALRYLIISSLIAMDVDINSYLTADFLLKDAELIVKQKKKPEIACLDLTQLPILNWYNQQPLDPVIIQAWLILGLEFSLSPHQALLQRYMSLLSNDSQQQFADYIVQQLQQDLQKHQRSQLKHYSLFWFIQWSSPINILNSVEYLQQLAWSNQRNLIQQQRMWLYAKKGIFDFDELQQQDIEQLRQQLQQEVQQYKQHYALN